MMTADEYMAQVFVLDHLPSEMSTKAFLMAAMNLLDPIDIRDNIAQTLFRQAPMVPHTTVHTQGITFSPCLHYAYARGPVSLNMA